MDFSKMEVANQYPTFGSFLLTDAGSSSSALAAPSGVSVAVNPASEDLKEGPAVERHSLGTVNDKDPCHAPTSTGNSNEALTLNPEVLEAVFSSENKGVMVGTHFCPYQAGYRLSIKDVAKVHFFKPLSVIEEDEIKSERPGSDSGYRKKEHDDLKKKHEVFDKMVMLRQAYSDFEKTKEFVVMNNEIKEEVLKLLKRVTGKNENFKMIVGKTAYTKILRTMFVQKVNMALKESFCDIAWRKRYFFPKFSNHGVDYKWWEQNYVPKILERRLEILREAAKQWNSERDIFMVIELVTDLNSTLHPLTSEKDKVEVFRLATTICSLRSGGDRKI